MNNFSNMVMRIAIDHEILNWGSTERNVAAYHFVDEPSLIDREIIRIALMDYFKAAGIDGCRSTITAKCGLQVKITPVDRAITQDRVAELIESANVGSVSGWLGRDYEYSIKGDRFPEGIVGATKAILSKFDEAGIDVVCKVRNKIHGGAIIEIVAPRQVNPDNFNEVAGNAIFALKGEMRAAPA